MRILIGSFLFMAFGILGCLSSVPKVPDEAARIPRYEELIALDHLDPNSENWRKVTEDINRRLAFSDQQVKWIRQYGTALDIFSAAMQMEGNIAASGELLQQALQEEPKEPVILISAIEFCLKNEDDDNDNRPGFCADLKKLAVDFRQGDPRNSLPYYLLAGLEFHEGNEEAAFLQLELGNQVEPFESHFIDRFQAVRKTALKLHYPSFTAGYHAFNHMASIRSYMLVAGMCRAPVHSRNASRRAKECLAMGEKIESRSFTMLEKVVGLTIQKRALESMDSKKMGARIYALGKRRSEIEGVRNFSMKFLLNKVPDETQRQIYEEFYEDFLVHGEMKAFELIAKKLKGLDKV